MEMTFKRIEQYKKDLKLLFDKGLITEERYNNGLALAEKKEAELSHSFVKEMSELTSKETLGQQKLGTSGYDPWPDKRNNKPGWAP